MGSNKEIASFMSYLDRMYLAEKTLIEKEQFLGKKNLETDILEINSVEEMNKLLPSDTEVVGFVPDHLEFGCREGVYVLKVESDVLRTHWIFRVH